MHRKRSFTGLAAVLLLAACATTGGMRSAPLDEGTSRVFAGEYDQVLRAAREAVVEAGLAVEEVDKINDTAWMIIAKKGMSGWSWGELVRVVVEKTGPESTSVRVASQRKVATSIAAKGDYSVAILSNIELKLK